MVCQCEKYQPLELIRQAITDRIRITKKLLSQLTLISDCLSEPEHKLYQCVGCQQLWQSSRAWNWENGMYLFKVPAIGIEEWINEPFMCPDEMLIYSAVMRDYFEKNNFVESENSCRKENCNQKALKYTLLCKEHFLENLHSIGVLPKPPKGRLFSPYYIDKRDNID